MGREAASATGQHHTEAHRCTCVPFSALCLHAGGGEDWGGEEGDTTMVKVLCSQRDRFRDRVNQLELQLAQVSHPECLQHKLKWTVNSNWVEQMKWIVNSSWVEW